MSIFAVQQCAKLRSQFAHIRGLEDPIRNTGNSANRKSVANHFSPSESRVVQDHCTVGLICGQKMNHVALEFMGNIGAARPLIARFDPFNRRDHCLHVRRDQDTPGDCLSLSGEQSPPDTEM